MRRIPGQLARATHTLTCAQIAVTGQCVPQSTFTKTTPPSSTVVAINIQSRRIAGRRRAGTPLQRVFVQEKSQW